MPWLLRMAHSSKFRGRWQCWGSGVLVRRPRFTAGWCEVHCTWPRAAGKSSLTKRVIGAEFPKEYQPTIISTYTRDMVVEQVLFHLDIVDTAGQVR